MLEFQINLLTAWWEVVERARSEVAVARDRGEITAQTALMVLLVIAALAAGAVIAAKIASNAENIPEP